MPETIEVQAFSFDELSDEAKERAREWYRGEGLHEVLDFDHMYDDFETCANILGIDINSRSERSIQGKSLSPRPAIYWTGFCSQLRNAFGLRATTKHRGHYYHSRSMDIDVYDARDESRDLGEDEKLLTECLIDFADWMYRQLDAENDYQYSDEAVDECIEANDYKFTEEGERHDYA